MFEKWYTFISTIFISVKQQVVQKNTIRRKPTLKVNEVSNVKREQYVGNLEMPSSYAIMTEEEMTYAYGGVFVYEDMDSSVRTKASILAKCEMEKMLKKYEGTPDYKYMYPIIIQYAKMYEEKIVSDYYKELNERHAKSYSNSVIPRTKKKSYNVFDVKNKGVFEMNPFNKLFEKLFKK